MSEDTQVVLLLCGRFGGEKQEPFQPLTNGEYNALASWLKSLGLRPSDLLVDAGRAALPDVQQARLEPRRVEFLLGRGTAMALALERWARGGLWVISRGDAEYPQRMRLRLKSAAPPLLYGAGDRALLSVGGLAIVGSRDISDSAAQYTHAIAARCAKEGLGVISGGARGADIAAMQGATAAGGHCVGVLPSDLLKASLQRHNRMGLHEGQLALVSPFYPEAGFGRGANAMARNRYIYTLADQALVIETALKSGGTWTGAVENLKHGWVPLYVRTPGEGPGNAALVAQGGLPFTLALDSAETLMSLFEAQPVEQPPSGSDAVDSQRPLLPPKEDEQTADTPADSQAPESNQPEQDPTAPPSEPATPALEELDIRPQEREEPTPTIAEPEAAESGELSLDMYAVFKAKAGCALGSTALPEAEIATRLHIEKSQARVWLKRASEEGFLIKLNKPVRYAVNTQGNLPTMTETKDV